MLQTQDSGDGILSASSKHSGGAQFCMAHGAVRFISENINTGDLNAAPAGTTSGLPSSYGTFGALGTNAGSEKVGEF